jgi:hypothetical protein
MLTQTNSKYSDTFTIGWIALLILSVLTTVWLIILMLTIVEDAPTLMSWAAFSLYASIILSIPFRRGEKWAWFSIWIQVILFGSTIFFSPPEIAMKYVVAAGLMTLCMLLTAPAFFQKQT